MWILAEFFEPLDLFLRETSVVLIREALVLLFVIKSLLHWGVLFGNFNHVVFVAALVCFYVANDIYICLVNVLEYPLTSHHSLADGSVNTHNLDTVSRLDIVHEVFIGAHGQGLWSFSFRH